MGNPFYFEKQGPPVPQQPDLGQLIQPQSLAPQGQDMQPQMSPPKDPADLAQRVSGWDAFFKHISTPEASQAFLNAGATMLAPRQHGVSQMAQVARGAAVGAETYSQKQSDAAEAQRRERLTQVEEKQVTQKDRQLGQVDTQIQMEQTKTNDFHNQSQKTLDLLTEQIAKAKADNSPEAQALADNLTRAETALRNAQAANYAAEAKRGGPGAGSIAAGVQEASDLANQIYASHGANSIAEATIMAYDRLHPGKQGKSPEELTIAARNATLRTADSLFPLARLGDPAQRQQQADWIKGEDAKSTDTISTYATRTGQTAKPVVGTGAPVQTPPTPEDITAYKTYVASMPAQKAAIDKKWVEQFGTEPPP